MSNMFLIKNLHKRYGEKEALKDTNLEIKRGEIFGILGPSGAGKTTLLRLLNLLDKPTNGKIFFDGIDTESASSLELRRRMAMVFQKITVFNMSVYDNVAYGLKVRKENETEIDKKVKRALELVGLSGYENRNAKTLSGGEAQRVAFAMATVFEPEVLLLDEPTANLDPINESIIEDIVLRINKLGITVVLATHKQAEAMRLADRIAVLNNGKIEQIGKPDEIFYKPKTEFVAKFVGTKNIIEGKVKVADPQADMLKIAADNFDIITPYKPLKEGTYVTICIRPEDVMIVRPDVKTNKKNTLLGKITDIIPEGAMLRLHLLLKESDYSLVIDIPRHAAKKMDLKVDKEVTISLEETAMHIIES
ncbi:MAG: ABC transporter ATP-binding protein [Euryarchaeota archaeon]|nr:ABC transporter ATP-binding protein [Euryarchaeota archaeon]